MTRRLLSLGDLRQKGIVAHDDTLRRQEARRAFPEARPPTPGTTAWFADEVDAYLAKLAEARGVQREVA